MSALQQLASCSQSPAAAPRQHNGRVSMSRCFTPVAAVRCNAGASRSGIATSAPGAAALVAGGLSAGATAGGRQRLAVVCMAHPRRVAKVSSAIQREISDMFVTDPILQAAICPERRTGDNTLSAVASITETYVSNDLQVVKVYVSVYSDDYGKARAIDNLQKLAPYVRRQIGSRVRLRLTPEVRFVYDDSLEEADLVAKVIGKDEVARYRAEIEAEEAARKGARPGAAQAQAQQAAAGGAKAADDEEEGFFDEEDVDEDEDGFDEDEDEYEEEPQAYPDPFGDLFSGGGEDLVGPAPAAGSGAGSGGQQQGRGKGGRR